MHKKPGATSETAAVDTEVMQSALEEELRQEFNFSIYDVIQVLRDLRNAFVKWHSHGRSYEGDQHRWTRAFL